MRIILLALFVAASITLHAQPALESAVVHADWNPSVTSGIEALIASDGGRVAVKLDDMWLIRAPRLTLNAIAMREGVRNITYANDRRHDIASRILAGDIRADDAQAEHSSEPQPVRTSEPQPVGTSALRHFGTSPPRHFGTSPPRTFGPSDLRTYAPRGCTDAPTDPSDPHVVRSMMKTPARGLLAAMPGTSDSMTGSTTVALFFLRNTGVVDPIAVVTSQALEDSILANVVMNLAWWSDQAAAYGRTTTFTIERYGFEHVACSLPFDPTKTSTPGEFLRNLGTHDTVMSRLGYTQGNRTEKITAYLNDLRTTRQTDWAYAAFIVTGVNAIRSNASLLGPVTNVWYAAARTGSTFAHETGHIYGGFDEYFEEGTEYGRSRQTRHGALNANHQFRNHPIVPCMMRANNTEGICSYTAVHVGITDSVEHTTVHTVPDDATFVVRYPRPNSQTYSAMERFQGETQFAWGKGMRVQLAGVAVTSAGGPGAYHMPRWNTQGDTLINHTSKGNDNLEVRYAERGDAAPIEIWYRSPDEWPAGGIVNEIMSLGGNRAVIASNNGVALIDDDGSRTLLDPPFIGSRAVNDMRYGYAIAHAPNGTLYIGTQHSEIISWDGDSVRVVAGPVISQKYVAVAVTSDGSLWGGCEAGLHRFLERGHDIYTTTTSPMLSTSVTVLAADRAGRLWVGYTAGRSGGSSGLQRFDPTTSTWENFTAELPDPNVRAIRIEGDRIAVATNAGFAIYDGSQWQKNPAPRPSAVVNDIALAADGAIWVATTGGVGRMPTSGVWQTFTTTNSEMPADVTYAIDIEDNGRVWIGTLSGTLALLRVSEVSSVLDDGDRDNDREREIDGELRHADDNASITLHVAPNPVRGDAAHIDIDLAGATDVRIELCNVLGIRVSTITIASRAAGLHRIPLALDGVASGAYVVRVVTNSATASARVIVER